MEMYQQQKTIHELIENQVISTPDALAITFEGQSLTYHVLNAKANQLARTLRKAGIKPESLVAVALPRSADYIVCILAILKAGGFFLSLDEEQPSARLQSIISDSQPDILITMSDIKEKFEHSSKHLLFLDKALEEINKQSDENLAPRSLPHHLAYVIYTSGTSGKPKGVLVEHQSVVNYIKWLGYYIESKPEQRIDFSSNPIFDMSITATLAPLVLGLHIIICKDVIKKNINDYLDYLIKNEINIIKITPSYFKILLEEVSTRRVELPALHTVILGGEILPTQDCAKWLAIYPQAVLFNEYGPTEATVAVSQFKVTALNVEQLGLFVPIGKPGHNITFRLTEIGELYVGGLCLARGYLNRDDLNHERFTQEAPRLYKTGDICRFLPSGDYEYINRNDEQIKLRGFRIEIAEIEMSLGNHEKIKDAAVVAHASEYGEKQLVAYYIPKKKTSALNKSELRDHLRHHLPDYMIPSLFIEMDVFPLNDNHKLDKKAFPAPNHSHAPHKKTLLKPLEQKVIAIFSESLGVSEIMLEDNFFEIGGHSLAAARIVAKIGKVLGKKVSFQDLYKSPTLRDFISSIERAAETDLVYYHDPRNAELPISLSDFQFLYWIASFYEQKTKELNLVIRKRMLGKIDIAALQFACDSVLKTQQILCYKIANLRPMQWLEKNLNFNIIENDLRGVPASEQEVILSESIDALFSIYPWDKSSVSLIVKLYYLKDQVSEIQICMPHIVSDDHSLEIIFQALSAFYHGYTLPLEEHKFKFPAQYSEYIGYEHFNVNRNLDQDIIYWENYLADTSLFPFPKDVVVNEAASNFIYSTYVKIPETVLPKLRKMCAANKTNIAHALSASLFVALKKYYDPVQHNNHSIFFNIIKSTRINEIFDATVGCFLKLDALKIDMNTKAELFEFSHEIEKSILQSECHQNCSSLLKFACANRVYWHKHKIFNSLVNAAAWLYAKWLPALNLNVKILKRLGRLHFFRKKQHFLININIWNNFIIDYPNDEMFGFKLLPPPIHHFDLSKIDNVLDVCFMKDDSQNPYLVISGNLQPQFREEIANHMIEVLGLK